ncbi:MAG: hypothetical protein Q8K45_01145 [Rubrivivax sp.]|nr:hypothetical protein [Rubrivivax sp.]
MKASHRQEMTGRSCPRCKRRADRMARGWFDRVLSLFMPIVRYRCASAECGWEGLLMRRHRRRPEHHQPPAYRPQWLDAARPAPKPPRP